MSNDIVVFELEIRGLVLNAEELAEVTQLLRSKRFLSRDYKGKGNGFAGGDMDYKLVTCDTGSRIEIKPVPENLWLYVNTFGKETK